MNSFALSLGGYPRVCGLAPRLLSLGYSRDNPATTRPQLRTSVNFGLILAAPFTEAAYRVNDQRYTARIPAFIFVQPGWVYQQDNPRRCEKLYFTYEASLLAEFPTLAGRPENVLTPLDLTPRFAGIIQDLLSVGAEFGAGGDADRLDLHCQSLITEFLLCRGDQNGRLSSAARTIHEIALYLDLHFAEPVDLGGLIRNSGLAERTFNRRWHEQFAMPPVAYLIRKRINEGCRLLQETDLRVYEIAGRVGFYDPYYFCKVFKKYTAVTPAQYRQSC